MPYVCIIPPHTEEAYSVWDIWVDDPENRLDGCLYADGQFWVSRERLEAWRAANVLGSR